VTGYDDERDQAPAAYAKLRETGTGTHAELRKNCHPLPDDAPGSATR
jgi:hypothetical protein